MSDGVLYSSEVFGLCLGVLLILFVAAMAAFVVRNRAISRGRTAYLVELHTNGRHRLGQAQVSTSSVRWFAMRSMSARPTHVWRRGDLELGAPRPAPRGSYLALTDPVRVSCSVDGGSFDITMNKADYTALRSWTESAPPGIRADVA